MVERRVEDSDLRHIRPAGDRDLDAHEVGRVVQRRERRELPDGLDQPDRRSDRARERPRPRARLGVRSPSSSLPLAPASEQLTIRSRAAAWSGSSHGVMFSRSRPLIIPLAVHEAASRLTDALGGASREQGPLAPCRRAGT